MKIGRIEIKPERFPWQGYGWRSHGQRISFAKFNPNGSRFGGGWRWKLGIDVGTSGAIVNLVIGYVRINWGRR